MTKKQKKLEINTYRFFFDGYKNTLYSYDENTNLFIRKNDEQVIKVVPYSKLEQLIQKISYEYGIKEEQIIKKWNDIFEEET